MKLSEFMSIMQYLPPDTDITINAPKDEDTSLEFAVYICTWGNHDGRFNVMCHACGYHSDDIPARLRKETEKNVIGKPCPKCGKIYYRPKRSNKS